MGLREPSDILIRFSLYQRMYSCTGLMNTSTVVDLNRPGFEEALFSERIEL